MKNRKLVDANIFLKSRLLKEALHLRHYRKSCDRKQKVFGKVNG